VERLATFAPTVSQTFDLQKILGTSVAPPGADEPGRSSRSGRCIPFCAASFDLPKGEVRIFRDRAAPDDDKIVDITIGHTKLSYVLLPTAVPWHIVAVLVDDLICRVATQRSDFRSAMMRWRRTGTGRESAAEGVRPIRWGTIA